MLRDPFVPALVVGAGTIVLAGIAPLGGDSTHAAGSALTSSFRAALAVAAVHVALFGGGKRLLSRLTPPISTNIWPLAAVLTGIGLAEIGRLRPDLFARQTASVAIGACLAVLISRSDGWRRLKHYKYALATAGLGLLALTYFFGVDVGGSRAWLEVAGQRFQPSEIVKVVAIFFGAAYLSERRRLFDSATRMRGAASITPYRAVLGPLVLMWAVFFAMIVVQRDLGGAFLLFSTFIAMLYVATGQARYVAIGGGLVAASGWVAYAHFSHVATRFNTWLDPFADPYGSGYQIVQSLFALAAGRVAGTGIGAGHPEHVPAVHTDFILSAVGEEMGLVGATALIALSMLVVTEGCRVALDALRDRDYFGHLVAVGITAAWGVQTFLIAGGTLRLVPLTGVTFPLVSYGGSSTVTSFIMLGLLMRLSRRREGAQS